MFKDYVYSIILHLILLVGVAAFSLVNTNQNLALSSVNVTLVSSDSLVNPRPYKELQLTDDDIKKPKVSNTAPLKALKPKEVPAKKVPDNPKDTSNNVLHDDTAKFNEEAGKIVNQENTSDKNQNIKEALEQQIAATDNSAQNAALKTLDKKQDFINNVLDNLEVSSLSSEELKALSNQLKGCWYGQNIHSSERDMVIELILTMNRDATIQNIEVVDEAKFDSDPLKKAVKNQVLRALRDPKCSPLQLPPNDFAKWHIVHIIFDPRGD